MKKSLFFILLLIQLFSFLSIGQQTLSGKDSVTKGQKLQSDTLNDYGNLWGWGRNNYSQLGDGTTIDQYEQPIHIGSDTTWKIISSGRDHSAGIKTDGTLWVCGNNFYGELGTGTTDASSTFVQIGTENNWKYVITGTVFTLAMKNDGSLWGWGNNAWGVFADSTFKGSLSPVKAAKILWGNIKYLCTGGSNCAAITNDGSLWMWGSNGWSTLGDGTDRDKCYPVKVESTGEWLTVACSGLGTVAIKKDGTLWRWGCNYDGYLREGAVAYNNQPKKYGTETNWAAVSVGQDGALALKKDGTLWAWGVNHYGAVGDGTTDVRNTPVQIGTDNDWDIISNSWSTSFATKKDGSLWSWGLQSYIVNPNKYFLVPTRIENMEDIIQISNNEYHTAMFIQSHLPKIPKVPEVVTLPITKITTNSAESGGNVTSDGKVWDGVRGICYSTKSNPTITDSTIINGQGNGKYQCSMKYLKPFTKYFVRAFVIHPLGIVYGQEETFTTKLEVPWLISPKNKSNNQQTNISLIWEKVEFAQNYRLQLSTSSTFDLLLADETTDRLTFDYSKYELNSVYYWRVQAISGVDSSEWSVQWSFTTSQFIPEKLLYPANDTINAQIDCKLIWKQNSANSTYILQVSENQNFTSRVIDIDLADTVHQSSILEYLTTYFWRVSAVIDEDQSEWSPVWKFTTLMDSVNLSSPDDFSKNQNIPQNMAWEESIYQKDYRLQISEADDFATLNTDTLISKINSADVNKLNYWQKYFWRVRNESGDTLGYWSEIWQFKTRMSDILLRYPENTDAGLAQEINFKWYPVAGAEYYQLQISKNDNFTNVVFSKDSIKTIEQFVPDLEKDVLYHWRVRVWNTETFGTAYWSEVWTFRTGSSGVNDDSDVIQIIPNPAGDYITITIERWSPSSRWTPSSTNVIQIYNTLGERVMTESIHPMTASHRMNIQSLPKGIYFVKVGCETAKFVKL